MTESLQEWRDVNTAVLLDLTAESAYPRQLEQAVAALRYLIETMGKSPHQVRRPLQPNIQLIHAFSFLHVLI